VALTSSAILSVIRTGLVLVVVIESTRAGE